ncbi:hypothetical protein K8R33_02930 [archaeon]|nr:hypothetical protein [archaeon]
MKGKAVWFFLICIVLSSFTFAITSNTNEFDDGGSLFNITSNYTGYLTIPLNSSISEANVTISGFNVSILDDEVDDGGGGGTDISQCAIQPFIANLSRISKIAIRLYNEDLVERTENITITIRASLNGTALSNITKEITWSTLRSWHDINIPDLTVNVFSTYYLFMECRACDWSDTKYGFLYDLNTDYDEGYMYFDGNQDCNSPSSVFNGDYNFRIYYQSYPENVNISVNGTNVFSLPGNLTGINRSIDLSTALESCNEYESVCPVKFSAEKFGTLEISDLFVEYSQTNYAILDIIDPAEITASINSGQNVVQTNINITNTGNYNASSLSFVTVSTGGIPNYNSSISWVCSDNTIINSSSILCNVTFSNLVQNPEPDEKLKIRSIGSDNNDVIFSPGIDVDITVTTSSTGSSGSGSGYAGTCNWKVYSPANRVISMLGWYGYKSPEKRFQIFNNESHKVSFNYRLEGLSCQLSKETQSIEGNSFAYNTITCDYPKEHDSGIIIIDGDGCSQQINVELNGDSVLGFVGIFLFGSAYPGFLGLIVAFILWLLVFVILFVLFKILE